MRALMFAYAQARKSFCTESTFSEVGCTRQIVKGRAWARRKATYEQTWYNCLRVSLKDRQCRGTATAQMTRGEQMQTNDATADRGKGKI